MDQALRNVIRFCDLTLPQALPMATSSPAQAMGWIGRKGVLQVGADADIILLDENLSDIHLQGKEKSAHAGAFFSGSGARIRT